MKIRSLAANQTEVTLNDGTIVFVSYETPVAAFVAGRGILRSEQYYSRTTSKHINAWVKSNFSPNVTETIVSQSELDTLIG